MLENPDGTSYYGDKNSDSHFHEMFLNFRYTLKASIA